MQTPYMTRLLLFGTYYDVVANPSTGTITLMLDGGTVVLDIGKAISDALVTYASTRINEIVNSLSTSGGRLAVYNPSVPQNGDIKTDAAARTVHIYAMGAWWQVYPHAHSQNGTGYVLTPTMTIPD